MNGGIFIIAPVENEVPPKFWLFWWSPSGCMGTTMGPQEKLKLWWTSLLTGAIAKIENATIHLDKSKWKNKVQVVQNGSSPLKHNRCKTTSPLEHKWRKIYTLTLALSHLCSKGEVVLCLLCSNPSIIQWERRAGWRVWWAGWGLLNQ